jgi:hypothetical protein
MLREAPGTGSRLAKHVFVDSTVVKILLPCAFVMRSCSASQILEPRLLRPFPVLASGKAIRNRDSIPRDCRLRKSGHVAQRPSYVERCWLCDQCATHIALRFDPRQRLVVASSLGHAEGVIILATPQSAANATTGRTRALIRSLDMNLRISTKRNTAGQRNVRRSEIA